MNYELAKKLKDAGFKPISFGTMTLNGKKATFNERFPTLDELIRACGDQNLMLIRTRANQQWSCELKDAEGKVLGVALNYETPSEAVANLWLKLKEK